MKLNIISVAFITGFIIYLLSLNFYVKLIKTDWRKKNEWTLEEKKTFLLGLFGGIPLVNTCILLYYFFNRSSR